MQFRGMLQSRASPRLESNLLDRVPARDAAIQVVGQEVEMTLGKESLEGNGIKGKQMGM